MSFSQKKKMFSASRNSLFPFCTKFPLLSVMMASAPLMNNNRDKHLLTANLQNTTEWCQRVALIPNIKTHQKIKKKEKYPNWHNPQQWGMRRKTEDAYSGMQWRRYVHIQTLKQTEMHRVRENMKESKSFKLTGPLLKKTMKNYF